MIMTNPDTRRGITRPRRQEGIVIMIMIGTDMRPVVITSLAGDSEVRMVWRSHKEGA